jgi:glycosyltransferase involved in cell wall biosynthesis
MDGQRTHILDFARALARQVQITVLNPTTPTAIDGMGLDYVQIVYPKQKIPVISYSRAIVQYLNLAHKQRNFDWLYLRSAGGYVDLVTLLWARTARVPTVIEVNGLLQEEYALSKPDGGWNWRARISMFGVFALLGINYRMANRAVAVTDNIRNYLIMHYGVRATKVGVFSNGVDTALFHPIDRDTCKIELGLSLQKRYVGYVGSLVAWQGVDDLLVAFHSVATQHPDWCLLIVGGGNQENWLRDLANQLQLGESVRFVGQVPHDIVVKYVNACDAVSVPKKPLGSGYSPIKIYEYLACGRPVLSSFLPGIEFVQTEGVGATFRTQDPDDLARALLEIMSLSEHEWYEMSKRARQLALKDYSWDIIAQRIISFAIGNVPSIAQNSDSP